MAANHKFTVSWIWSESYGFFNPVKSPTIKGNRRRTNSSFPFSGLADQTQLDIRCYKRLAKTQFLFLFSSRASGSRRKKRGRRCSGVAPLRQWGSYVNVKQVCNAALMLSEAISKYFRWRSTPLYRYLRLSANTSDDAQRRFIVIWDYQ